MTGDRKEDKNLRGSVRRPTDARGGRPTYPSKGRVPRAFRPLRWAWLLLLVALLAPAYDLFLPAGYKPPRERRTVVIEHGQSLHEIARELQRVGVIRSQAGFLVLARMMRLDRSVKAGQYSFRLGMTVPALLRALDRGMYGLNLVTIPEGLMVSETAALIEREVGIPAAAIDSLAKDPSLLDSLQVGAPSLEGWLAPDSYEWLPGTSPEVVLRTMVSRTRERVQRATAGYDSLPLGMNAHEVLTLASIVESESRAKEERPHIARVYLNRLDRGMLLQADPTVGYAQGRGPRSRLTFKDLRVESPYNTYRHEGLPPGPICSPGEAAIEAVMNATPDAKDLYFVARGQGRHLFAPTYEQHLANIAFVRGKQAALAARSNPDAGSEATPDSGGGKTGGSNSPLLARDKPVGPSPVPVKGGARTARCHQGGRQHAGSGNTRAGAGDARGARGLVEVGAHERFAESGLDREASPGRRIAKPAVRDSSAHKTVTVSGAPKTAVHDTTARKAAAVTPLPKPAVHDSTAHKSGTPTTTAAAKPAVRDTTHKMSTKPAASDTTRKASAKPAAKPAVSGVKPPAPKAPADTAKAGKG